jgi:hypothetical protein
MSAGEKGSGERARELRERQGLTQAQLDGRRLQGAIDAEYRGARRDNTWGHTQPQIVERWRLAMRGWLAATETALAANQAALGRFRAAPAAVSSQPGESADWIEMRNALTGKLAVLDALLEDGTSAAGAAPAPPPRSVWRKP